MPLPREEAKIPSEIADISIELTDYVATPDEAPHKAGRYSVQVWDQNGNIMRIATGDLVPHLTPAQISGISDLLDALRAKAVAEILP